LSGLNDLRGGVELAEGCDISLSYLEHVTVGPGCRIHGCHIQGTPEAPIVIGAQAELRQCELSSTESAASFSFGGESVAARPVHIGEQTRLFGARIENSHIGARVEGKRCHVLHSVVGDDCKLRPHASLTLTWMAPGCHIGSEVSKSLLLGQGFTSEHAASYLSLVAPSAYPIVDADGAERLLEGLPNLTNIGAGTVFANYSGKPKPPERRRLETSESGELSLSLTEGSLGFSKNSHLSLSKSSGSLKGTAIAYGVFIAVNAVIVNRYGKAPDADPFGWMRRRDLTILGLCSFVEGKVTGRIPAFSYAGGTRPQDIRLGWVLERQPGIVLNIIKKMRGQAQEPGALKDLIEGTIRLELQLLREQRDSGASFYPSLSGFKRIALFERHLESGRWKLNDDGELTAPWAYDEAVGRWRAG